ncbi:hypothetical protein AKN87_10685 [Thiopseudomonas alkaliphila]|uniref:Phosphatidic acid phosphatase type 2/haloperoxidase domain-containing protein n=1 Tax=Thiopseudomonas alkaliphila TaxID=1697053 RepID=A0A0K1XF18_9GAMM|nr:phosphatase PAP2 family protein [Thiopseudomonas alkaliphila]AKX45503.1 hypothetical protein AKN87_10685 [Thiopseudomonas alkaliphila]AKX50823.1 hypothetical protein AKN92_04430 [Thiopseudomonas alkaliphila]AKX53927.1 hypothetical protein AKN91_09815 [Thiopseudomonas alkaliphila]AKX55094.1 hypothetical protein AKN90_04765 [Thiopseudomonas alkaliphila]AKX57157.1 hypothetical protein AKN89_04450 [Thiopseudomonas alkaliphila]
MASVSIIQARWRKTSFILLQLFSILLLSSWLIPSTASLWRWVDEPVYRLLNGSLGHFAAWDLLWAFLSTRVADLLAGSVMLISLIYKDFIFKQAQLKIALLTFISLLTVMLIWRTVFTKVITQLGLQHASPSVFFGDGFQLSQAFPWMERYLEIKDRSSRSFPGDHASVLLLWLLFTSYFAQGKQRLLVIALGIFFILPRLVAGAHWLSDNLVGGLFLALQSLAWGYCTPLTHSLTQGLNWMTTPILRLAQHVPGLKLLAIVQAESCR